MQALKRALDRAEARISKLPDHVLTMEGMSGVKYRHLINNLIEALPAARYLEVGSWAGSTLCSAIHGNRVTAVAIDDWSQFGGPVGAFRDNVSRSLSRETAVTVLSQDFRTVDYAALGRFNVYLFDGPHEEADHHDGLTLPLPCLDDQFVFIVDDWNWARVRRGTEAAIARLGLTVRARIEVRTTDDDSHPAISGPDSDWHNGCFIGVLEKSSA